jgi:hypothetical protein
LHEKMLRAFANWFASGAGVWQTVLVTLGIVIAEYTWPDMDPHGFWLLYWMTIYSAATQPALAYVSRQSDMKRELESQSTNSILLNIKHLDEEELEALKRLVTKD